MAAGGPYSEIDGGAFILHVLQNDLTANLLLPGGFWAIPLPQMPNVAWRADVAYGGKTFHLSTESYFRGDYVLGSDGRYYRSLQISNLGHDPLSSPAWWALAFPCVRWWWQSPGSDVLRQDGQMGRVESTPRVIIAVIDRQTGGSAEFNDGPLGPGKLKEAIDYINTTFHARTQMHNGFQFTVSRFSDWPAAELGAAGDYNVEKGQWFQIWAQ